MLRILIALITIVASSLAAADPVRPERVDLSPEESERARSGEVVVHQDPDGMALSGVVFVRAAPDTVLRAVIDFPPRVDEIDNLESVEPYRVGGHPAGLWSVDATIRMVNFHVIYECDMEGFWCAFGLDESEENDITMAEGSYAIYSDGEGSWLEYRSRSRPPAFVPTAMRESRREASTIQMLTGIKNRAEGDS